MYLSFNRPNRKSKRQVKKYIQKLRTNWEEVTGEKKCTQLKVKKKKKGPDSVSNAYIDQ